MDKSFTIANLFHLLNILLLIYLTAMVFGSASTLPDQIPTHFDLAGHPDNFSSKHSLYFLLLVPWGISLLGYLFLLTLPFWQKNPHLVSSPGLKRLSHLPAEKQAPYWVLVKEFMAGLLVCLNVLFYIIVRQTILIARRHIEGLNTGYIWFTILLMLGFIIFYMIRLGRTTKQILARENG